MGRANNVTGLLGRQEPAKSSWEREKLSFEKYLAKLILTFTLFVLVRLTSALERSYITLGLSPLQCGTPIAALMLAFVPV